LAVCLLTSFWVSAVSGQRLRVWKLRAFAAAQMFAVMMEQTHYEC
jgi:hypothetical protein